MWQVSHADHLPSYWEVTDRVAQALYTGHWQLQLGMRGVTLEGLGLSDNP